MAGPYTSTLQLSNGQILRLYQAANQAAGTYCPCEINGEVASTSPIDFEVASPCYIQDIISPQTAGIVQIYGGQVASPINFLLDARWVTTNQNRQASLPHPGTYIMVPGKRYRIYQKTAGAA